MFHLGPGLRILSWSSKYWKWKVEASLPENYFQKLSHTCCVCRPKKPPNFVSIESKELKLIATDETVYKIFHTFLKLIYLLFYFTMLYWFCHTSTWIFHGCTCVPHPEPPSHLPPHPIPLGHPNAPALSTLSHAQDWWFLSHMIIYNVLMPFMLRTGDSFHIW